MQFAPTFPLRPRTQAIPMAAYRRRLLLKQMAPRAVILALALVLYPVAVVPGWLAPGTSLPIPYPAFLPRPFVVDVPLSTPVPRTTNRAAGLAGTELVLPNDPTRLASGAASMEGIGPAATANIKIAIEFLDGTVITPGEKLSFDDTARTWDFNEDPRYLMGKATSARGLIDMRGGGVCWLSTALWRAALWAGLPTDYRENHYGLVPLLVAGYDATNTLVIHNNTPYPLTVRAGIEGGQVYASLYSDQPLDRTAEVRGPFNEGRGQYVLYQDIYWDNGEITTEQFDSNYLW
jgi:hypothetical protein